MRFSLFCASLLFGFAVTPAAAAPPAHTVAEGTNIDWSFAENASPERYRVGDTTLVFEGRPESEDSDLIVPVLRIFMRDFGDALVVEGTPTLASVQHRATVGRWDSRRPYVLFQSFSGGAHCCNQVQIVYPGDGRLQRVDLGEWDGDYLEDLPTDLDGDGNIDFVFRDNAFLYAFESYAGSAAPPQVINVERGLRVDVSARPAFRRLFEEEMNADRPGCVDDHSNGACAAYVAAAARVGRFDRAWAEMLEAYDRNADWPFPVQCRVDAPEDQCPGDQRITTYPEALRRFLIDHEYIRR